MILTRASPGILLYQTRKRNSQRCSKVSRKRVILKRLLNLRQILRWRDLLIPELTNCSQRTTFTSIRYGSKGTGWRQRDTSSESSQTTISNPTDSSSSQVSLSLFISKKKRESSSLRECRHPLLRWPLRSRSHRICPLRRQTSTVKACIAVYKRP